MQGHPAPIGGNSSKQRKINLQSTKAALGGRFLVTMEKKVSPVVASRQSSLA